MAWRVGMKVECVDATSDLGLPGATWGADIPVEGNIYTVSDVLDCYGMEGLLLKEIRNTPEWRYAFNSVRFRPVVDRSTDTGFSILADIRDGKHRVADEPIDPAFEEAWAEADPSLLPEYVRGRG